MRRGTTAVGIVLAGILGVIGLWHVRPAAQAPPVPEWQDPAIVHVNTEAPHATFMAFPDAASAFVGLRGVNPHYQSLDGQWKFNWVPKPADRPVNREASGRVGPCRRSRFRRWVPSRRVPHRS